MDTMDQALLAGGLGGITSFLAFITFSKGTLVVRAGEHF